MLCISKMIISLIITRFPQFWFDDTYFARNKGKQVTCYLKVRNDQILCRVYSVNTKLCVADICYVPDIEAGVFHSTVNDICWERGLKSMQIRSNIYLFQEFISIHNIFAMFLLFQTRLRTSGTWCRNPCWCYTSWTICIGKCYLLKLCNSYGGSISRELWVNHIFTMVVNILLPTQLLLALYDFSIPLKSSKYIKGNQSLHNVFCVPVKYLFFWALQKLPYS